MTAEEKALLLKGGGVSGYSQSMLVITAVVLVAGLCVLFVYIFRKKILRRPRQRRHRPRPEPAVSVPAEAVGEKKSRRKWRRHRRPLNPTLAQTHGLPPVRGEETPPKGV